jgi:hypothetical protein
MDQSKKALIAVALLVIAGGLFFWQFRPRKAAQAEITQDAVLNSAQAQALESIFRKVESKKWSDPSLWSSSKAAGAYAGTAEKLFTSTPSMDKVKVLDYGMSKEHDDAPYLILQVVATGENVIIEFKPKSAKDNLLVLDSITAVGK